MLTYDTYLHILPFVCSGVHNNIVFLRMYFHIKPAKFFMTLFFLRMYFHIKPAKIFYPCLVWLYTVVNFSWEEIYHSSSWRLGSILILGKDWGLWYPDWDMCREHGMFWITVIDPVLHVSMCFQIIYMLVFSTHLFAASVKWNAVSKIAIRRITIIAYYLSGSA